MYKNVLVPVDNSRHSNRAIDVAVAIGKRFDATATGCHVYAARMHDYRFKQMEFTLPEEYLVEQELHRQRKIHDSLITMGLELISDCYLESMKELCTREGVPFAGRMMDGKHSTELVRELAGGDYDLAVLGVVGMGKTRDSQVGSVCSRLAAESSRDVWVVKHVPEAGERERDTVLVGVDGSPKSFGALQTAIELCKRFDKKLEVIAVYDPYLHYAVFKGVVEVLTDKAAKVFRFEEQNQLHEEIIDTGLAAIYQSHLNVAEQMAREQGIEVTKTLLDGKAFQKVLDHCRKTQPWVLIIGRLGVHSPPETMGLGSNTENLLRMAPCDVLLTTTELVPELDTRAEESIHWTPEALERMQRVPPAVLGIARTAILRLAIEQGHSVVSSDLVTEAMERFMPKRTAELNVRLAEALVQQRAEQAPVRICRACGTTARTGQAVKCQVCGSEDLATLDAAAIARIIDSEGGTEEETTYDGRKVRWTQDAKEALRAIDDRYQRRRAKARIEKAAHGRRTDLVTLELAARFIEEETGILFAAPPKANGSDGEAHETATPGLAAQDNGANGHATNGQATNGHVANGHAANGHAENGHGTNGHAAADHGDDAELHLVARDGKGVPLLSARTWSTPALERIVRVPAGYMRDRTQERVEALAAARGLGSVDLDLVEEGIELGRQAMEAMIAQQAIDAALPAAPAPAVVASEAEATASKCPFSRVAAAQPEALRALFPLDEVSVMSELEKKRRELAGA